MHPKDRAVLPSLLVILFVFVGGLTTTLGEQLNSEQYDRELVIIPTLGWDHQKNLDYSVAHLMAVLKKIK